MNNFLWKLLKTNKIYGQMFYWYYLLKILCFTPICSNPFYKSYKKLVKTFLLTFGRVFDKTVLLKRNILNTLYNLLFNNTGWYKKSNCIKSYSFNFLIINLRLKRKHIFNKLQYLKAKPFEWILNQNCL